MLKGQQGGKQERLVLSYDSFIYNHQFERKLPVELFFYTRRGLTSLAIIASAPLISIVYMKYVVLAGMVYFMQGYIRTKLKFSSKYTIIESGFKDEAKNGVLLISLLAKQRKKIYNSKNQ